jgi:hypothetical protein
MGRENLLPLPGLEPRTAKSVASRYPEQTEFLNIM